MAHNITESEFELIRGTPRRCTSRNCPHLRTPADFFHENPDLFRISPRPGGFLRLLVPSRSQDFMVINERIFEGKESCPTVFHKTNVYRPLRTFNDYSSSSSDRPRYGRRRFHIRMPLCSCKEIIEDEIIADEIQFRRKRYPPITTRVTRNKDSESTFSQSNSNATSLYSPEVLQKAMDMLAVTISCVMQIAARYEVPLETLICTRAYLQCIKDERRRSPRNICGILDEIRTCLVKHNYSDLDEEELRVINENDSKSSIGSSIFSNSNTPEKNNLTSDEIDKSIKFAPNI